MREDFDSIISVFDILDSMPGIVFWKSANLTYSGANKKFLDVIGLSNLEQLVGKSDGEIAWPEQYAGYFAQYDKEIISSGKPILSIEQPIMSSEYVTTIMVMDKYPLCSNGNIVGVLGISNMIYDQQLNSQVYLNNLMELLPYFIFWKDASLVYQGCNRHFAHLVGKQHPVEVIGKTDFDLGWGEGEAEAYQVGDRQTMLGHTTTNAEEVLVRPDGSKIVMLVNKLPLLNKVGECVGVVGTSTDITEFRNTQSKLQEAQERLLGIKTLGASIAHEIRTPLSAIRFGVSGAQDYLPALVEAYHIAKEHNLPIPLIQPTHLRILSELFQDIESEVAYSETIIDMMLMNVRQKAVSMTSLNLCLMSTCIEEAMRRYPFKPHEGTLVHWKQENDFNFYGDNTLMVHILFNLLKNALYYIQVAQKGEITIWYEEKEKGNILYFRDTGRGIPADVLPQLFQKFYTTTYHGTGLGLSFCKMVMLAFGGDIRCGSVEGEFTQFEMIFPIPKDVNKR